MNNGKDVFVNRAPGAQVVPLIQPADKRQAKYYKRVLDEQQAQVDDEIADHYVALAKAQKSGDLPRIRRVRQTIREKQRERERESSMSSTACARRWNTDSFPPGDTGHTGALLRHRHHPQRSLVEGPHPRDQRADEDPSPRASREDGPRTHRPQHRYTHRRGGRADLGWAILDRPVSKSKAESSCVGDLTRDTLRHALNDISRNLDEPS